MGLRLKFCFFASLKTEKDFDAQQDSVRNKKLYAFAEQLKYEEVLQDSHLSEQRKIHFRQIF